MKHTLPQLALAAALLWSVALPQVFAADANPGGSPASSPAVSKAPQKTTVKLAPEIAPLVRVPEDDPEVRVPQDVGWVDATKPPYNAKGDGVTDDTAAIQLALSEAKKSPKASRGGNGTVYLPPGTYLIKKTLGWYSVDGKPKPYLALAGAGREKTVIRLADGAEGFGDAAQPKPVLVTNNSPKPSDAPWTPTANGNEAFANFITDLSLDTGKGNPGAVGIDFMGHNLDGIERVTIRSSDTAQPPVAGLVLSRDTGPSYITRVIIDGFKVGISAACHGYYPVTLEHIVLRNQTEVAIRLDNKNFFIRGLRSENKVPAVQAKGASSLLVLADSELVAPTSSANQTPESSMVPAVDVEGAIHLTNVKSQGYARLLRHAGADVSGNSQELFIRPEPKTAVKSSSGVTSHATPSEAVTSANDQRPAFRLPIRETPASANPPLEQWQSVRASGAVGDGNADDTDAIQSALDAGKPVVYFPWGTYRISRPLRVPPSVLRVEGFNSVLTVEGATPEQASAFKASGMLGVFAGSDPLAVERLQFTRENPVPKTVKGVDHRAPRDFIVRNLANFSYVGRLGAGDLYADGFNADAGVSGALALAPNQNAWIRQLNIEARMNEPLQDNVINIGAKLWIFGLKHEMPSALIRTVAGGETELLGGWIDPVISPGPNLTAFLVCDARLAISLVSHSHNGPFNNIVEDSTGGERRVLRAADLLPRPDRGPGEVFAVGLSIGGVGGTGEANSQKVNTALVSVKALSPVSEFSGAPARLQVTRLGTDNSQPLTITLRTRLPAAKAHQADASSVPKTVVIPAHESTVEVAFSLGNADSATQAEKPVAVAIGIAPANGYRLGYPSEVTLTKVPPTVPLQLTSAKPRLVLQANRAQFEIEPGTGELLVDRLLDGSGGGHEAQSYVPLAPRLMDLADGSSGVRSDGAGSLAILAAEEVGGLRGRDANGKRLSLGARTWAASFTLGEDVQSRQIIYRQGHHRSGVNIYVADGVLHGYMFGVSEAFIDAYREEYLKAFTKNDPTAAWRLDARTTAQPGATYRVVLRYDPEAGSADAQLNGQLWESTKAATMERHSAGYDSNLLGQYIYGLKFAFADARSGERDGQKRWVYAMGYPFGGALRSLLVTEGAVADAELSLVDRWLNRPSIQDVDVKK